MKRIEMNKPFNGIVLINDGEFEEPFKMGEKVLIKISYTEHRVITSMTYDCETKRIELNLDTP